MAVTLNDVSLLGFSLIPKLLAHEIAGRSIVVMGYSGNDFHILRAIVDGQPNKIWWIVLPGNIPNAVDIIIRNIPSLIIVEGDLSRNDSKNPLVALWEKVGHEQFPSTLVKTIEGGYSKSLHEKISDILSELDSGQKGMVLHSLIRRAGLKTTLTYRKNLSILLHNTMYRLDGFSRGSLSYAKDNDWVEFYERLFTPHIAARPALLRHHGISLDESCGFEGWKDNELFQKGGLGWKEEADILAEIGLENAFRGNFDRSKVILEAALKCAKMKGLRVIQMRSTEALAWVCLWLNNLKMSNAYHASYLQYIKEIIRDLGILRNSKNILEHNDLLRGFDPPNEPKLFRVIYLDHRYRKAVCALRLAGRLRYIGKPDLGIEVLKSVHFDSKNESLYVHSLRGYQKLEMARCLFFLYNVDAGLQMINDAEKDLKNIEYWDYEVIRYFYRTIQEYYVKTGRMGMMMKAMLNASRVL
jgi:hypothetical protein